MPGEARLLNDYENCRPGPDERLSRLEADKDQECGRPLFTEAFLGQPVKAQDKQVQDFQTKHGLEIKVKDGKYTYVLSVGGQDKELFTTDATAKGLEEAERQLAKLADTKRQELERVFKVSFSSEGEDILKQWVEKPDCTWERGPMIKARAPRLHELYGIEAALYRSQPSHLTDEVDSDGQRKGLKFYFLTDNYYKDDPALAYFISADKNHRAAIYFEPGANDGKPATEKDSTRLGRHLNYSVEALTCHELAHNAQRNMGWNQQAQEEKLAAQIGWTVWEDPKSHERKWVFKGAKGELFRYDHDRCKETKKWFQCNKSGEPLNDKGQPVKKVGEAKHYTRAEVRDQALVSPITHYFVNPKEMFAEGIMIFRLSSQERAKLLSTSPALYDAVKQHDQEELNKAYHLDNSGQPRYIRNADGYPVENNEQNRKALADFEAKHRNKR